MNVAPARLGRFAPVALTLALTGTLPTGADAPNHRAGEFDVARLTKGDLGFSESEVQRVAGGEVIVRGLEADDESVAMAGMAVLAVPPEFFIERVRQIEEFKKAAEVLQIARFSTPPSAADLGPLSLDKGDLDEARECRAGGCALKLDEGGIDKLRAVGAGDVLSAYRSHLAEYTADYLRRGNAALMTYHDHGRPQTLLGQLERILKSSSFIAREWPDLHTALANFSGKLPDGLQDFTYWSKEKVGPRASVTLTHMILRPPQRGVAVIASKQIYASHYATGSLGVTVLIDQSDAGAPRTLLVYVNRTRVDMFGGVLGGVKRSLVRSRARAGAERMMVGLRTRLQAQFQQTR